MKYTDTFKSSFSHLWLPLCCWHFRCTLYFILIRWLSLIFVSIFIFEFYFFSLEDLGKTFQKDEMQQEVSNSHLWCFWFKVNIIKYLFLQSYCAITDIQCKELVFVATSNFTRNWWLSKWRSRKIAKGVEAGK